MRKQFYFFAILFIVANLGYAQSPTISSWYRNTTNATNPTPGYTSLSCNVQSVYYTTTDVYVSSTSIPAYSFGSNTPYWPGNPGSPTAQSLVTKFTLTPAPQTGTKTNTGLGAIGLWINGMALFNAKDANYWNGSGFSMGISQTGWNRNAYYWEGNGFDQCNGHPAMVLYHNHVYAKCMTTEAAGVHSKIVGYAFDGYPIYGPYAYTNIDGTGPVKLMKSSYVLSSISSRSSGTNGTGMAGPPVNSTYPLGSMCEDYVYTSGTGDLDIYNGRTCITPEYPGGTYAYFVTINSTGIPQYPFVLSSKYYGVVATTNTHQTIPAGATQYFGPVLPVEIYGFTVGITADNATAIRWNAGEETNVAFYQIERSVNGIDFTTRYQIAATSSNYYQHIDARLTPGKYFYRIKTVDRNGIFKYSAVVSVTISQKEKLIIHNNPSKDLLTIQSFNALHAREISLISMSGQVIQHINMPQGTTLANINIQTVYAGMYVIRVSDGQTVTTAKVVISN